MLIADNDNAEDDRRIRGVYIFTEESNSFKINEILNIKSVQSHQTFHAFVHDLPN
jgi:hypothetical protein